jgi:hypothetical protein
MTVNVNTNAPVTGHPAVKYGVEMSILPKLGPDLLDPESMLAFFGQQMREIRGQLAIALRNQEARNRTASSIQQLEAKLVAFQETGIKPGDADKWPTFVAAVEDARKLLGPAVGPELDALIAKATKDAPKIMKTEDAQKAADAGAHVEDAGCGMWLVTGAPAGLDKNDVQSFANSLKASRDKITNDNAMNMIGVQQLVESSSQVMNLCSNIMKKLSDMAMAPINNMR